MVADHWLRQVERILEAVEITSDATRIRLATFQLKGESQIWWDLVKVSRDPETRHGESSESSSWISFSRHLIGMLKLGSSLS